MDIAAFAGDAKRRLNRLAHDLATGAYRPGQLLRIRTRVARYLVARAARVQKSVFMGRWTPAAARKVHQTLERMIDTPGDQIMMEAVAGQRFEAPRTLIF